MVWLETPTNPTLRIVDIAKAVKVVKENNKDIFVVVDNTFMSSYFQVCISSIVANSLDRFHIGKGLLPCDMV